MATVPAVEFDGTNDYIQRDGALTGAADGKQVSWVFWFKRGATGTEILWEGATAGTANGVAQMVWLSNRLQIQLRPPGSTTNTLLVKTNTTYTNDGVWRLLMCSCDLSIPEVHLFVGDTDDQQASPTLIDNTADLTHTQWTLGANSTGALRTDTCIANWWVAHEFIDFSVEANRRKFINASGEAVDLGSGGGTPTGTDAIIFFSGDTSTWHTNDGTGGGFTEIGALTDCSDGPPAAVAGGSAGIASGASTVAANSAALKAGVGAASGASTVAAVGVTFGTGAGVASGVSTVAATGAAILPGAGVGVASGASTVTATGAAIKAGAGVASGASTVAAVGTVLLASAGAASGASTVTIAGTALLTGAGAASGSSVVTTVGEKDAAVEPQASGVSTVAVGSQVVSGGAGAASGLSTVAAVGSGGAETVAGQGLASGLSAVDAVGVRVPAARAWRYAAFR